MHCTTQSRSHWSAPNAESQCKSVKTRIFGNCAQEMGKHNSGGKALCGAADAITRCVNAISRQVQFMNFEITIVHNLVMR